MTTKTKLLNLGIGEQASFFSKDKDKNIEGTIVKINNKTVILEVEKERTIIEKVKGLLGKMKIKKNVVIETKHIKKRFNQLIA